MRDAPRVFQGINDPYGGVDNVFYRFYRTEKPAAEYSMPAERVVCGKRVNSISREYPYNATRQAEPNRHRAHPSGDAGEYPWQKP